MKRVDYVLIGFLVLILFAGCKNNELNEQAQKGIIVKVEAVKTVSENPNYYVGIVEETVSVPLSFMTTGTVERVMVNEGQSVRRGQVLATLKDQSAMDAYQIALAKEKQAQDAFDRLSEVHNKGSLPEIKFVEIETALAQAKASLSLAKKNVEDCKIIAPADGMIGHRSVEPGANIIPGNTVLTLVKIDKVYINISVPEKEISKTLLNQSAEIVVSALDNEKFSGSIVEKGVVANPVSHTYNVKILVENKDQKLMPGMVCQALVDNGCRDSSLVIPAQAVQETGDGSKYVYLAKSNRMKPLKRNIQTGSLKSGGITVVSGLQAGDSVITEGYQKIDENTNIIIAR